MIDKAANVLKQVFGHDSFRGGQEQVISALLSGRDALAIMPTGAGKSLCFQVPALMLPGVALVVSPLIALMKDQVTALIASGVKAAYLNSSLSPKQMELAMSRAALGHYKIIYVAPERLLSPGFLSFANQVDISLVAVDEAHCVSQWGQDFRPAYVAISDFVHSLKHRPPIGAFTATATLRVRQDIQDLLNLESPERVVTGYDRPNLFFQVRAPQDKMDELLKIEAEHRYESGIVYCSTRKAVEQVHQRLSFMGVWATRYHAGLSDDERQSNQDDFINDRRHVMVATNAFGMGIDKSNVSYVVHYNMPKDLESYYQEAGRAGRDGEKAECILLYSGQDVYTAQYLIDHAVRPDGMDGDLLKELLERDRARLRQMTMYATTNECLRDTILNYFDESKNGFCGNCGSCLTRYIEEDLTPEAHAIAYCIYELATLNHRFGKGMVIDILRGSVAKKLIESNFQSLQSYGKLKKYSALRLRRLIDEMLSREFLALQGDEYPTLMLTEQSDRLLDGSGRMTMKLPEENLSKTVAASDVAEELFQTLRKLRSGLAKKSGMPAYILFTDAALRDMAKKRPLTLDAFAMVSGVGRSKSERYGLVFINEIRQFLAAR